MPLLNLNSSTKPYQPPVSPISASNFVKNAPNPTINSSLGAPKTPLPTSTSSGTQGPSTKPITANNFVAGLKPKSPSNNIAPVNNVLATKDQAPQQGAQAVVAPKYTSDQTYSQITGGSQPPVPSQPQGPDYQGLYGQLITQLQQKAQQPNQDYALAQAGLLGIGNNPSPAVAQSQADLKNFQSNYAQQVGGIEGTPIPLEFQQGRKQVLANQYANELPAYQTAVQNALTGQGQQISAFGQGVGAANTQQGLQQSGLLGAADSVKPQLGSIGQVPFNPLNQSQGAVLGSTQPGGLSAAGNLLGQFQGAQTAGATQGGIQSTQAQTQAGYQSALQQAQNVGSQLTDLIQSFGLNPNDVNAVNSGLQKIAANTSDPHYQALNNYVNSIANLYSQILTPAGGSGTDTTRAIASSMLDATAKGSSITQVMQQLDQEAQARIAGVSTTGSGSSGSTFAGSAWQ